MTNKSFTTKSGQAAIIRQPLSTDASQLMDFINHVSLEDSFIRFSGEQQTLEEEEKYLASELRAIEVGDAVKLFCFINNELVGACDIHRDISLLKRKRHTGILGIIVSEKFRGEGIGKKLILETINLAKVKITDLRLVKLEYFATNTVAEKLYQDLGFTEIGRVPGGILHKNQYVDEVTMVMPINQL